MNAKRADQLRDLKVMPIGEVIARIKDRTQSKPIQVVEDWRQRLPPRSRWFPGCLSDPACQVCWGTGYLRLDLPIHHPRFGMLHLCECMPQDAPPPPDEEREKAVIVARKRRE